MKEYTTKEMKAGEPEFVKEERTPPMGHGPLGAKPESKAVLENKRGRYYVKDFNGQRLAVFLSEKEAKDYINEL